VIGVRQAAIVSNLFTIGKLIPLIIFIASPVFSQPPGFRAGGTANNRRVFAIGVALDYAFTGFEMATIPAGEVRDPKRNLPHALLIAIAVVAFVYILIQVVWRGTLPGLAESQKPLADASMQFMGAVGGAIISAGAIISITGNLNILVLSVLGVPFAMAEQEQLPSFIARVHRRFSTPHVAILISAGLMLLFTLKSSFAKR